MASVMVRRTEGVSSYNTAGNAALGPHPRLLLVSEAPLESGGSSSALRVGHLLLLLLLLQEKGVNGGLRGI